MARKERYQKQREAFTEFLKWYPFTLDDLDGEQWADITGYDGLYQISTFGRVKSFKTNQQRILRPALNTENYLIVHLWKNNKVKFFTVHRLVAQAFIPNPDNKLQVNHIDGCKINACVGNLEWATNAENIRHAFDTGLLFLPQGEDVSQAKLTNKQVRFIRDNPENLNTVELAKRFNVTSATISDVQIGKKYKTAGGKIRQVGKRTPRLSNEIRDKIRAEYVYHSRDFNCYTLGRKYGVDAKTICRIVHEK